MPKTRGNTDCTQTYNENLSVEECCASDSQRKQHDVIGMMYNVHGIRYSGNYRGDYCH